jgi:hypothetical protein
MILWDDRFSGDTVNTADKIRDLSKWKKDLANFTELQTSRLQIEPLSQYSRISTYLYLSCVVTTFQRLYLEILARKGFIHETEKYGIIDER